MRDNAAAQLEIMQELAKPYPDPIIKVVSDVGVVISCGLVVSGVTRRYR
jgi:hypothetical protein